MLYIYLKIKVTCLFIIMLSLINLNLNAQVTQIKPLDVIAGLNNETIHVTIEPSFTKNTIEKLFDGNPYTEAAVQNSDTLNITFEFEKSVAITKSKVFFWNNGTWTLEAANTENDLNNKSGSYQLLVDNKAYEYFKWDSLGFTADEVKYIRLKTQNFQNSSIYFGEWTLYTPFTIIKLGILPDNPRLLVGTSFQLKANCLDKNGNVYPYDLEDQIHWKSENTSVASFDEDGTLTGISIGTTVITAYTTVLAGTSTVSVEEYFESTNAQTIPVKVALVLQNPVIDFTNNRKINQVRSWTDPLIYVNQILEEFSIMSDGVIQFEIVESYDDEVFFTLLSGELMSIDTVAYFYNSLSRLYGRETEGTLQNLAEIQGLVRFDYNAMIDYYDFDTKRNNGVIDEVWVYAPPFGGMYESQLVGPNAFWYNSPPLAHPGLEELLSVMGWNYERGVAEAIHSFGHRMESAMVHAYGDRWNVHAEEPTSWEIFTRIDTQFPDGAHIGNIHFPPNGVSDYDYSNRRYATTYADNWIRYPILLDQHRTVNCQEWGCTQLGYMRWWFNHLPRFTGVTDGVLNNWWHYAVDYDGAVEKAAQLSSVDEKNDYLNITPGVYSLEQNYPNPFNSQTNISYDLLKTTNVQLIIFNLLGQKLKTLVSAKQEAGIHHIKWDGKNDNGQDCSSGMYLFMLKADNYRANRKLILLR